MALDVFSLNGLSLNDETNYALLKLDMTPPAKKPEWAQGADSDGAGLIRTPLFENRTVTAELQTAPQATMNAMLEKISAVTDQLQESEKNPGGIPLEWSPASSSKTYTLYVLTGAITAIPLVMDGEGAGFYYKAAKFTIQLTCKPYGYAPEVEVASAKANETGLSTVVLTVPSVAGDVPAEGRLVVKDTAAVGRRFVEWGLENRYYNAATSLILDSEDMVPVGGVQSTALNAAGAYRRAGATKGTIATTLVGEPTVCCNTGVLTHIGTFRVKARIQATLGSESLAENVHVRLSYQDGEGPLRANVWQTPVLAGKLVEVDLGSITITQAQTGTQKWLGQVEAYSENKTGADTLHVDYLTFIPVGEGYGKARGVQSSAPGTVSAFDSFTTGTLSGNLNTRTPPVGSAWVTSGAATDWTVESGAIKRAVAGDSEPRFGVFGAALANSRITAIGKLAQTALVERGVIIRWTNSLNYAFMSWNNTGQLLKLGVRVAGVTTILAEVAGGGTGTAAHTFELSATLDGVLAGTFTTFQGSLSITASHAAIATGGALASGKGGIFEQSPGNSSARTFSRVNVTQLAAIPYCIQPSRTMEVRSDSTITADSTGTYYGPVPQYRGSRFLLPQEGSAKRTSRILVKADRNDLEESDEQTIADAFTVQVFATPRYLAVPH